MKNINLMKSKIYYNSELKTFTFHFEAFNIDILYLGTILYLLTYATYIQLHIHLYVHISLNTIINDICNLQCTYL